jgi:hypothetical protein
MRFGLREAKRLAAIDPLRRRVLGGVVWTAVCAAGLGAPARGQGLAPATGPTSVDPDPLLELSYEGRWPTGRVETIPSREAR